LVISIIQSKVWLTKTEENSGNVCTTKSIQGAKYVVTVASLLEVFGSTNDPICSNVTLFVAGTAFIEHSGLQSTMAKKVTELCAGSIQLSVSKISQNTSSLPSSGSLSWVIPIYALLIVKQDAVPVVDTHSTEIKVPSTIKLALSGMKSVNTICVSESPEFVAVIS